MSGAAATWRRPPAIWGLAGLGLLLLIGGVWLVGRDRPVAEAPRPGECRISPADGQAAIAAAIRGCPDGSTVRFPPKAVYHQTARIEVYDRANLVVDGNGSSFLSSAPNVDGIQPNWLVLRGHDVTFKNMTVEGNFDLNGPRSPLVVGRMASNQANAGFYLAGGINVSITDVTVRDVFGDFVVAIGAGVIDGSGPASGELPSNIRISRLHGTRSARHGVALTVGTNLTVEDSRFEDNWYGGIDAEIDVPGQPLKNVRILNNTFAGYHFFAIAVPAPGNDGDVDGVEIRGNKMTTSADLDTCGVPILIGYYEDSPYMANIVVEDNEMKSQTYGVYFRQVSSGAIRNNRVELVAPASACGTEGPVYTKKSPNVVVSDNVFVGG